MALKTKNNYVSGTIGKTMLKTALSMIPGTLAISGFNLADSYFVAQLGRDQQAAIGLTFPVIMLLGCFFRGIIIGIMTTASHALGEKNEDKAAQLTTLGMILMILISLSLGIVGYFSMEPVFAFFRADAAVIPHVLAYMGIWYLGCVTSSLCMTTNDMLVSSGIPLFASSLMIIGLMMNVVLDPIFMFSKEYFTIGGYHILPFGLNMGVKGAAYATVISQAFGAFAGIIVLTFKFRLIRWQLFPWREIFPVWKKIIRFAIPASVGMLMIPIGMFILTQLTIKYGTSAVAACTAAGRLETMAFVFPMSLGMAIVPMVAQNYGAKQFERINQCRRFAMRTAALILFLMTQICMIFAPQLAGLFEPPDDPSVKDIIILYLRNIPLGFAFLEIHRYGGFFYTGCGKPAVSAMLNALRVLILMIPLSYAAYWIFGVEQIDKLFWARAVTDIVAGTVALIAARVLTLRLLKENRSDNNSGNGQESDSAEEQTQAGESAAGAVS